MKSKEGRAVAADMNMDRGPGLVKWASAKDWVKRSGADEASWYCDSERSAGASVADVSVSGSSVVRSPLSTAAQLRSRSRSDVSP